MRNAVVLGERKRQNYTCWQNSGGYVGYGEISEVKTPNFNVDLGCTMTRFNKQREFEVIGISPKYYLTNQKDWIEQALELLKKQ